jgi:PadR family transcriptional regulator PadR
MNIENTQSQMRKGVLEFCILSIIQREVAYPSDIIDEMKKAHLNILEGTLYPLLTRLKNADLLAYRWVESSGGPPRKYFSLTEKGAAFYKELENTWREMSDSVERVIGGKRVEGVEELSLPAEGREVEELNLPVEGRKVEEVEEVEGVEGKADVQAQPEESTNTEPSSTNENIHPPTEKA